MKNSKSLFKASTILIWLSFAFIAFSFIAPYIFTASSYCNRLDFTGTGTIGDTIGGIMNPFIAIAGVITTFLAFRMQVEANKIQKLQFLQSLQKEKNKEKLDSLNNLQILELDLENTIKNIDENVGNIREFINASEENPFKTNILFRTSLKQYERIKQIPRQMVFRGFDLYVRLIEPEWTIKFNDLYNIIDYTPEALNNIYTIVQRHNSEIFTIKSRVREDLIKIEKRCIKILDIKNRKEIHTYFHSSFLQSPYKIQTWTQRSFSRLPFGRADLVSMLRNKLACLQFTKQFICISPDISCTDFIGNNSPFRIDDEAATFSHPI